MYTVIILNQRSLNLLKNYRFLFKPFLDKNQIVFCDWNEEGTDIKTSVPDLYKLIRGKKEWRAIVLDTNSISHYNGIEAVPDRVNPFDYSKYDNDVTPHESKVPLIRLVHMLGGYNASIKKEFEKAYQYYDDELGETITIKESEFQDMDVEIQEIEERIGTSVDQIYVDKEIDPALVKANDELVKKYSFSDSRPIEIELIATRNKVDSDDRRKVTESWKNYQEMDSSTFWERNKYPNNCRFICHDVCDVDNSKYEKEVFEFWLGVLLLSINRITPSSFQAYRLYHFDLDVDDEKLGTVINNHLDCLQASTEMINKLLRQSSDYSFEEEQEILTTEDIPLVIESSYEGDLYVPTNEVGLSTDGFKRSEMSMWRDESSSSKNAIFKYSKAPRRAIDRSAKKLRQKSDSFIGNMYELDQFMLEDLHESLDNLQYKIITTTIGNTVNNEVVKANLKKIEKPVVSEIEVRMNRATIIVSMLLVMLITIIGYAPYLVSMAMNSMSSFLLALMVVGWVLVVISLFGLAGLIIFRQKLIGLIEDYNSEINNVISKINQYGSRFHDYFTNICTYMKGQSILIGMSLKDSSANSNREKLNHHKVAIHTSKVVDEDILLAYNQSRVQGYVRNASAFFNPDITPRENKLYVFDACTEFDTIELNDSGDNVKTPYLFIEHFNLVRIDIYDEEGDAE